MVPFIGSRQSISPVAASTAQRASLVAKKTEPSATDGEEVMGASVESFQRGRPDDTSTQYKAGSPPAK
jgi:hypothetical protein